jgi:dTDP-4-dehydrorhamnose reductase
MRVVVIGSGGQLGTDLCAVYAGAELTALDIDQLDVRDADACNRILDEAAPDLVINTAAAHNVPKCEEDPATAFAVNAAGARNLAIACNRCGARLVHISTDYVFGNGGHEPYVETDLPAPLNVYAASKLAGEHLVAAECANHQIFRGAALYGAAPCLAKGGMNFVRLMLHLAATRPEVKVVTDEITTPTYTRALAEQIRLAAEKGEPGLYHATCNGACSWYDFAQAIFEETGTKANLLPTTSAAFPSPVKRPSYSVLENKHLQDQSLDIMPHWRDGLRAYLKSIPSQSQS